MLCASFPGVNTYIPCFQSADNKSCYRCNPQVPMKYLLQRIRPAENNVSHIYCSYFQQTVLVLSVSIWLTVQTGIIDVFKTDMGHLAVSGSSVKIPRDSIIRGFMCTAKHGFFQDISISTIISMIVVRTPTTQA